MIWVNSNNQPKINPKSSTLFYIIIDISLTVFMTMKIVKNTKNMIKINKVLLMEDLSLKPTNQILFFFSIFQNSNFCTSRLSGSQRKFQFLCLKGQLQVKGYLYQRGLWIYSYLWATISTPDMRPPSHISMHGICTGVA